MPQTTTPATVPRFFATVGADYSASVPTSPITLLPAAAPGVRRNYLTVINVGGANAPNVWCSWYKTPAPNTPGSFCLAPYANTSGLPSTIEFGFDGGVVPQIALQAVSDGGTGGQPALVTATVF